MEVFIGKRISDLQKEDILYTTEIEGGGKMHTLIGLRDAFCSRPLKSIVITTKKNDGIESVSFQLEGLLDVSFYKQMVDRYGKPDLLYKRGEETFREEVITEKSNQITESKGRLVECGFEENPLFIVWASNSFYVQILNKKEINKIDITFSQENNFFQ
ncbi:hypothetical protein [Muriicola sp. Z0-33]|uniref:hypothetical protein n=1 Tax=Muriicola sp. Z0-33 TaxID=2816957 RepID=UPI0022373877|nr:hypothetical protein [Muriicola sp. Z0-33]MCW5515129.1 hypothetical protein [Muriicola sp. Z0-33]